MKILKLSNSTISAFADCTLKGLMHILGWEPVDKRESKYLLSGAAAHEALALHLQGYSVDQCIDTFAHGYKDWALRTFKDSDWYSWPNMMRVMQAYLMGHPVEQYPFEVREAVEKDVEVELGEVEGVKVNLIFRYDFKARMRDTSEVMMGEWKTTGANLDKVLSEGSWQRDFEMDSQLSGEIWGMRSIGQEINGALVAAIGITGMPTSERMCKLHEMPHSQCWTLHGKSHLFTVRRQPWQLELWRHNALKFARKALSVLEWANEERLTPARLAQVGHEGIFHRKCGECQFFGLCKSNHNLQGYQVREKVDGRPRSGLYVE